MYNFAQIYGYCGNASPTVSEDVSYEANIVL